MARLDNATGWRRRALRLVDLCMRLDAEHVLCKAMKRWPVAALLEATEGWNASMFALVARDWRLRKVARLLEAKGRSFTVECCEEWEPEYLQVLLPELDLVTARHVLGHLYFKSDDKHLSAWECRCILEQFSARAQRKLLRKFTDRDVSRVMNATESAGSSDEDSEGEEGEDEDDGSLGGFLVDDCEEGDEEMEEGDEDVEDVGLDGEEEEEFDGEGLSLYGDEEEDDSEQDGIEEADGYDEGEEEEEEEPVVVRAAPKRSVGKRGRKEKVQQQPKGKSKKGKVAVKEESDDDDDDDSDYE